MDKSRNALKLHAREPVKNDTAVAHATDSNTYKKTNIFRSKIIIIIGMTDREITNGAYLAYSPRGWEVASERNP